VFPKIRKFYDGKIARVEVQYLNENVGLDIDENICQGCGICMKVCPRSALTRGPVGNAKKNMEEGIVPTSLNPQKCSFCGLCTYMCPWEAITLKKNGEKIPLEELTLVQEHAVPELMYEMKKCKEGIPDAKSYLEGDIEFFTSKCAGGCNTCIEVCPTGALSVKKPDAPWDKGREIVVDKDKCILCGTCTNACPVFDAIKLKITNVKYKGKYNPILWDRVIEQLKISRMRDGKKIN